MQICALFMKQTSLGNLISDSNGLRCNHTIRPEWKLVDFQEKSAKSENAALRRKDILHYEKANYDKEKIQTTLVHIITNKFPVGMYC